MTDHAGNADKRQKFLTYTNLKYLWLRIYPKRLWLLYQLIDPQSCHDNHPRYHSSKAFSLLYHPNTVNQKSPPTNFPNPPPTTGHPTISL